MTADSAASAADLPHPAGGEPTLLAGAGGLASVFAALPGAYLLLTRDLRIAAVSEAYLATTHLTRPQLVGQLLPEVFAGRAGAPEDATLTSLRASLQQVLATGQPHRMDVQPYNVPDPAAPGTVSERYWQPLNAPVLDEQGAVSGLVHSVVDVTSQVRARQQVQARNEKVGASNAELRARNAAYLAANTVLRATQQQQLLLNRELETRVQQRTQQLAEQQRLLQQILRQVPAAIATLSGPDHRLTFANAPYHQLLPGRAGLGQPVAELLPELAAQGLLQLLDRVYASGQPYAGQAVAAKLPPSSPATPPRYFDFTCQPLTDGQGRVQGVLTFAVEVTEQVLGRRERETRQAELQSIFEQAPVAITILRGPELLIELANEAVSRLWGCPATQALGRPQTEVLPELVGQGYQQLLLDVLATGQPVTLTEAPVTFAQGPAGQTRQAYLNFSLQPLPGEPGRPAGLIAMGTDVTDQVLARRELIQQRALLQTVFAEAPVAIGLLRGPAFVIELANAGMAVVWGQPLAALLGRPLLEVLPAGDGPAFAARLARVLGTGEPLLLPEAAYRVAPAGGPPALRYYTCRYQPLRDPYDLTTSLLCLAVDVTEQVLARQQVQTLNQELNQANAHLTRTNADLDTFVYTASHDLKVPIANIEGLVAALQDDLQGQPVGPAVPRLLELMQHAVARFQQTIGHLADIARLQQEASPAEPAPDLGAVLAAVQLDLAPLLDATGAEVTVAVTQAPPLPLSPKNLRSVLYNLLSNAAKYRAPTRPPRVRVECAREASQVVLRVHDNGLGLTPAQQGKLFALFRRLHTHVEGSGVGLYMVKRIVENAGGTVAVQSEAGVGTTFTLAWPLGPS